MSRRGGGRGTNPRQSQPAPAPSRGGAVAGRGRAAPSVAAPPNTAQAAPAARPAPAMAPSESPATSSSSAAVESLAADLKQVTVAAPASSKAVRFPPRPGFGKAGKKCVVRANHFLVKVADTGLCQYDVSITPEVISKKINRLITIQLEKLYRQSHLGGKFLAYDGGKSLYTAGELPFVSKEFIITLPENDDAAGSSAPTRKRLDREFKVSLKLASKPDLYALRQFLQGRQAESPQETIQVLDVVLRQAPSLNYTVVGRFFFDPSLGGKGELGDGIEYWKGYYQSLRPTQMGLSLNVDVSARAFYEPIPVTHYVVKYLNLRDAPAQFKEQDRLKVRKALRAVKVVSNHLAYKKTYKVAGLSVEPINKLMFKNDEGRELSVAQYFREKYKIALKYSGWPAIQVGSSTKPVYLPMEICTIVGGQRYTRKLNEGQVRNILRATCQRPADRERSIKNMITANDYNSKNVVNQFGIQVTGDLATVDARVLPPPALLYHGTGQNAMEMPRMGQWNMIDKKMINGGKVDYWTCVNFSRWSPDDVHHFCHDLVSMCTSRGMAFKSVPVIPPFSANPNQIEKTLVELNERSLKSSGGKLLQLLIIILPDFSGTYGKIKTICETELGIVSQCCQPKQAGKPNNKQYLENLSLKINVKVGGRNTVLCDAMKRILPIVTEAPTIIFGADVTHPQPGEDSSPSIAAVVASMDWPEVSKYRGLVSAQAHREEIIQDLYSSSIDPQKGLIHGGMIRDLLIAFYKSTGAKPKRILFYRDGVSEGQFSQVLLHEMDAIRKGCMSLEANYLPPVTFVVVQKRHHTRLFPSDPRTGADRSGNILPGTVVDTKICHPTEFDFYLNSHAGIQGTSRPTHYHVLYDENRFSADGLQILTNSLCYTYARCTRSVSIVPPAYYAHLAAFRARYYIEGDSSDAGSSSGGTGGGGPRNFRPLPTVKENVKDVMFYC